MNDWKPGLNKPFEERVDRLTHAAFAIITGICSIALLATVAFRLLVWLYAYAVAALR